MKKPKDTQYIKLSAEFNSPNYLLFEYLNKLYPSSKRMIRNQALVECFEFFYLIEALEALVDSDTSSSVQKDLIKRKFLETINLLQLRLDKLARFGKKYNISFPLVLPTNGSLQENKFLFSPTIENFQVVSTNKEQNQPATNSNESTDPNYMLPPSKRNISFDPRRDPDLILP